MPIVLPKKPKEFWPYFSLAIALVSVAISLTASKYPFVGLAGAIVAIAVPLTATEEWKTGLRFKGYIASMFALGTLLVAFALGFRPSWIEGSPIAWLTTCAAAFGAAITHWVRTRLQDHPDNEEPPAEPASAVSVCQCACMCGAGRSSAASE